MASAEEEILSTDPLEEFKDGLIRSMKQYNAGQVKTANSAEEFLEELHNSE
ncbi:Uncharacterised protein [uncultured archaeon]|nr:Uncharacterised protein [uncultured archaeon]